MRLECVLEKEYYVVEIPTSTLSNMQISNQLEMCRHVITHQAIAEAKSSTRTSRCALHSTWAGPRGPRVEGGTTPQVSRVESRLRILEGDEASRDPTCVVAMLLLLVVA